MHKKAKTRLLTIFVVISFILLMAVSLTAVFAATTQDVLSKYTVYFNAPAKGQSLNFRLADDGNSYIVTGGSAGINNIVAIPSTYNDKSVSAIETSAFENNTGIKTIMIFGDDINIKSAAFKGCNQLKEISVYHDETEEGGSVNFEDYAFQDCVNLNEIHIEENVMLLSGNAFAGCVGLNTITVEETHEKYYAAGNCLLEKGTNKLILGSRTGYIPEGVTQIEKGAYSGLTNLTSLTIPNSVEEIAEEVFSGCTGLTEVTFGDGVQTVKQDAFKGCNNIKIVNTSDVNNYARIEFGDAEANPTLYSCSIYENGNLVTDLVLDTAKQVGFQAFVNVQAFKSITIGASVEKIEGHAFNSCIGLYGKIIIPENVKTIGEYAFNFCVNITSLEISDGVESIDANAFRSCSELKEVKISGSVKSVGADAFIDCSKLEKLHIDDINKFAMIDFADAEANPIYYTYCIYINGQKVQNIVINTATKIGNYTFHNAQSFLTLSIGSSVKSIGLHAFNSCINLGGEIVIPDSVTSMEECVFNFCIGITSVKISNNITTLGRRAFAECKNLQQVTLGDNLKEIKVNAFLGCEKLTSISIPNKVENIGVEAFKNCSVLNTVHFGDSVKEVDPDAFINCPAITKVDTNDVDKFAMIDFETNYSNPLLYRYELFENNVRVYDLKLEEATKIGVRAFVGLKINTLTIGLSVKSIGAHAFNSCTFAGALVVPDSVTSVGDHAFNYCINITSVTIGNGLTNMETSMFQSCTGLKQVTIGSNVNTIMHYVFNGCTNLTSITIPSKVTTIGIMAFNGCGLTNVEMVNPNNWYYSADLSFTNPAKINENLADNTIAATCLINNYKDYVLKQIN